MGDESVESATLVVGIDGSRAAVDAAMWAVDEAVSRDIPLRLVYAIDPDARTEVDPHDAARDLATAEIAVRSAFTAVESTDKPVKIEVEIMQARPVTALRDASRRAAMLCVGSVGLKHSSHGQIGATAAALATSAHCPVAVVRGYDPHTNAQRPVVAEVDDSPASDEILQCAVDEARLRHAPLRVVTSWQSRFSDVHDNHAVSDGNRLAKARLERRLARWRRGHPDVDIGSAAVHGNVVNYLVRHGDTIQLLVVGHERAHGLSELMGPPGYATLQKAGCSVLVCERQNVL